MRNKSHATFLGILRQHVIAWRKQMGWSRETVVQVIVETHVAIHGPEATAIVFDPTTRDAFERMKVNADRVFRWLDDEHKDNNTMPVNFLWSVLTAMPMDIRLHCVADLMRPIGINVEAVGGLTGSSFNAHLHLGKLIKESSEASIALNDVSGDASVDVLERARREVADVLRSSEATMSALDAEIVRKASVA